MIKLYTKTNCVQCIATKKELDRRGLQYEVIDLDEQPDLVQNLIDMGYQSVPVVQHGDDHWSGYRPDKLQAL